MTRLDVAYFLSFGKEANVSAFVTSGSEEVRDDGAISRAPEESGRGPVAVLCCGEGSMLGTVVLLMICYKIQLSSLSHAKGLILDRCLPETKGRCPQRILFRHRMFGQQRLLKYFVPTYWVSF